MKDQLQILSLARRCLMVLAAALLIGLALYLGSSYFKGRGQTQLTQAQQSESANQASLAEMQSDLANMQAEISRFQRLRQQGMVGTPEREGWVEQLLASRQRTGLPDTLVYTLQAPRPLALQAMDAAGSEATPASAEATTEIIAPVFHDLDFAVLSIHEEELLALLRHYQAQVKGRFRVNACMLSERTETGLTARCTLRFFTMPDVAP
ncbi:MAG: hypothetical protein KJ614_03855 [Gammaproteobacteria bacterium]|uniref:hypothetical protein n=1 Tax=Rhodoferax sp. TaxID=50421 RepID=UPI00183D5507|nr:hypothetical protein [Rhodoferax sp.]MBU3898053.1 hypothetical protein [Gammaproteobacteria bacterium]MBA3058552.1 hypothetical protein [Rhodoferax sp.]MBU3999190.1 hypothetical protein [Gammaproteobacteria bacterium]MBU4081753.1 hypothetical protein [Gammaproteobacteria bacterium]MBU4112754.1 hypothetical protein [Gammaproteobacteria bacterium]